MFSYQDQRGEKDSGCSDEQLTPAQGCLSLVGVALVFDAVSDPVKDGKCLLESPGPGLGLGPWMMHA